MYFDVTSYPAYGALSGQRIDEMQPAGDGAGDARKRDPRDFALWKGAQARRAGHRVVGDAVGRGRPGWHLECSAMADEVPRPEFDIHGGGLDLRVPAPRERVGAVGGGR